MIEGKEIQKFNTLIHDTDICVVGGGLAGMCAAISAARHGTKVVLMHDRPVLGGNASSEIRMWIRGAHGENMRETGLLEEIALENIYRNPSLNFSLWDSVLYGITKYQENLELILNCSCNSLDMENDQITSVTGWQTTTQQYHKVNAKIFIDCSGDSVLAPLSGAEWVMGREASSKFGENIAPVESDNCTMGSSCLFQARETNRKVTFIPPKWANKYTKDSFPHRLNLKDKKAWERDNYWWIELGGTQNTISDTEELRDELLKIVFGAWDFIKNGDYFEADNWDIEWVGFLPGKRESRRYVGDYTLTQEDVKNEGRFDDIIAYGGWTMDDHDPRGFATDDVPNIFHPAPSPFGIPYRCLYSKNIDNLMFAGRNISTSHTAFSATRVMATCATVGQAAGTAAAIAIHNDHSPRDVYRFDIEELKQTLMEDDCYIPWNTRKLNDVMKNAEISVNGINADVLLNGKERPIGDEDNKWIGNIGDEIIIDLKEDRYIESARIVFDSELNRESWTEVRIPHKTYPMRCNIFNDSHDVFVPRSIVKKFSIYGEENGEWKLCDLTDNNYQRLVKIDIKSKFRKIKLIPIENWGETNAVSVFSFDLK